MAISKARPNRYPDSLDNQWTRNDIDEPRRNLHPSQSMPGGNCADGRPGDRISHSRQRRTKLRGVGHRHIRRMRQKGIEQALLLQQIRRSLYRTLAGPAEYMRCPGAFRERTGTDRDPTCDNRAARAQQRHHWDKPKIVVLRATHTTSFASLGSWWDPRPFIAAAVITWRTVLHTTKPVTYNSAVRRAADFGGSRSSRLRRRVARPR